MEIWLATLMSVRLVCLRYACQPWVSDLPWTMSSYHLGTIYSRRNFAREIRQGWLRAGNLLNASNPFVWRAKLGPSLVPCNFICFVFFAYLADLCFYSVLQTIGCVISWFLTNPQATALDRNKKIPQVQVQKNCLWKSAACHVPCDHGTACMSTAYWHYTNKIPLCLRCLVSHFRVLWRSTMTASSELRPHSPTAIKKTSEAISTHFNADDTAFLSSFSPEEDKAIRRKVDRRFLWLIGLIYLIKNVQVPVPYFHSL